MKTLEIKQQKSTAKFWSDESGQEIPYNRINPHERELERKLASLTKKSLVIQESLFKFKAEIQEECINLYSSFLKQHKVDQVGKGKGGMTYFNFDRSLKIELQAKEPLTFDPNTIALAKEKLEQLLNDGLQEAKEYVKPLVMDAFNTSSGKLDPKRVLGLRRYKERINDIRYSEAMDLIDKAIRKCAIKQYYKVWIKDFAGQYQDVQLNFASISLED